jgi:hypothetical protein
MQYGQLFDPDYNPDNEPIYELFVKYFDNPVMTKIKDVNQFSMYVCEIKCGLSTQKRYLIVLIHKDERNIGSIESLKFLQWQSIQTRTLSYSYNDSLTPHYYRPHNMPGLTDKIILNKRDSGSTLYDCEKYPLKITLLHTQKDSMYEYTNSGSIVTALETYHTIISFSK